MSISTLHKGDYDDNNNNNNFIMCLGGALLDGGFLARTLKSLFENLQYEAPSEILPLEEHNNKLNF